jgi:protein required for attachment to host cells
MRGRLANAVTVKQAPLETSMTKYYVVVASKDQARLYTMDGIFSELTEIDILENPEARKHERDLISAKHGRAFDSTGQGRHAFETEVSARDQVVLRFTKAIANQLADDLVARKYEKLIVVAAPKLLGLLRKQLSPEVRKVIAKEITKNLSRSDLADLMDHIKAASQP